MTPEKQRIAIAEACGWSQKLPYGLVFQSCWFKPNGEVTQQNPPNYPSDLNAMHEANKSHPIDSQVLWNVVNSGKLEREKSLSSVINATAAQRAEAFLRTIGKWEE